MRQQFRSTTSQQGMVLIAAIALLMVIGIAVTVSVKMAGSGLAGGVAQERSNKALFYAESGIERVRSRYNSGVSCTGLSPDPASGAHTIGNGSFTVTAATEPQAETCLVTVEGRDGDSVRSVTVLLKLVGSGNFIEQFPDAPNFGVEWTVVGETGDGTLGWISENCPISECPFTLAGSGALEFQTDLPIDGAGYQAAVERNIPQPLSTGAGDPFDLYIGMIKAASKGSAARADFHFFLIDTGGGHVDLLFSDVRKSTPSSKKWDPVQAQITPPADRTYDRIRIVVDLLENATPKKLSVSIKIDDIEIVGPGAVRDGSARGGGGTIIQDWSE